jgi:voltage-gated potassium channel
VTATLIPFVLGRDAEDEEAELAGSKELVALCEELQVLHPDIRALSQRPLEI